VKVLIIDKKAKIRNGVTVYNQRLSDFLKKHGHVVKTIYWSNERSSKENPTIHYLYGLEKFHTVSIPSFKSLEVIKNAISDIKPDIVYIPIGLSIIDFLLPAICKKNDAKLVGILHADAGPKNNFYEIFFKYSISFVYGPTVSKYDLIQVLSQRTEDFLIKKGMKKEKIMFIPNGVDTTLYTPGQSEFAKKNKIKKGVLFLGRLSWQKNPEALIKSFLKINPANDTKLVIIGVGDLYKKLIKKYKDERIIFTGFIDTDEERIDIIRSCQVIAFSSRAEGMPLSLLEAMSCGLLPIVTDVGACKDVVGETGFVIEGHNVSDKLSECLIKVFENEQETKNFGKKARERIIENYNLDTNFSLLTKKLESLSS
jgi:glycosyltransferase involved in cell wall biosynthesis